MFWCKPHIPQQIIVCMYACLFISSRNHSCKVADIFLYVNHINDYKRCNMCWSDDWRWKVKRHRLVTNMVVCLYGVPSLPPLIFDRLNMADNSQEETLIEKMVCTQCGWCSECLLLGRTIVSVYILICVIPFQWHLCNTDVKSHLQTLICSMCKVPLLSCSEQP